MLSIEILSKPFTEIKSISFEYGRQIIMPLDKLGVQGLGEKSYFQLYFIETSFFYFVDVQWSHR